MKAFYALFFLACTAFTACERGSVHYNLEFPVELQGYADTILLGDTIWLSGEFSSKLYDKKLDTSIDVGDYLLKIENSFILFSLEVDSFGGDIIASHDSIVSFAKNDSVPFDRIKYSKGRYFLGTMGLSPRKSGNFCFIYAYSPRSSVIQDRVSFTNTKDQEYLETLESKFAVSDKICTKNNV